MICQSDTGRHYPYEILKGSQQDFPFAARTGLCTGAGQMQICLSVQSEVQLIFAAIGDFPVAFPVYEPQGRGVHAVTQTGWFGPVVKNVAKVSPATCTMHFRTGHKQLEVGFGADMAGRNWCKEAGPSR